MGATISLFIALRPITSNTTVITTASTVCRRAKMSMLNRLSTVNSASTAKATVNGGMECG
ncbi:hypothetical protein D3C84_984610 [compost metagenome]